MSTSEGYSLIVTFNDGTQDRFRFPKQTDPTKLSGVVQKLLTSPMLSLELEGSLFVIPTTNIRSVEVIPAPEKVPDVVLRGVRRAN